MGAAAALAPSPASAASFAEDGTFVFDPQAVATFDFEGDVQITGDAGPTVAKDDAALSGGSVLVLGVYGGIDLPVTLPAKPLTYRVSLWMRGGETVGDLEIQYGDRPDEVAALYPTGRITSDGWVELANDGIRVDGARAKQTRIGLFSPGGAQVDAVEVVPDGTIDLITPNATCSGVGDPSSCAPDQICMWSECRNESGWVPPIPADREDVTDYLEARMRLLFGPFAERTLDLPASLVAIEQMREAKDRWSFWSAFMLAIRRLHDGHTVTNGIADFVIQNPKPLAVCFIEGDGDLSQAAAPKDPGYLDVLVSHTGGDHNLGLHAGDRLVGIDGQHPIAWARSLVEVNWGQPGISNHTTYAELASGLRRTIPRFAHDLEVIRCDPVAGTCGPIETILMDDIPADPPDAPVDQVACDNRPLRHLPTSPPSHAPDSDDSVYAGIVTASDDVEKIYGIEWESLYVTGGDPLAKALGDAVASWKADARGVILDHRLGHGGTTLGAAILWNFPVKRHASNFYEDRQHAEDEQPTLAEGQAIFQAAVSGGDVEYAGVNSPVTDVPVALLLTEDVSASDWLPLGMKGTPNVRLFAPFQTNGAFSTRYSFGYWLSLSYVIAVGDTYVPDGSTHNGTGIEPDQVVLPKQSDLMVGKDTLFEAAIAWVRQGLKP